MRKILKKASALLLAGTLLMSTAAAADWPQFLGEPGSQGFSDGQGPESSEGIRLRWKKITGSEWVDVPGTPIVVGDYVYYYSSQYLRKLELSSGKEVDKVMVYGEPINQFFINIAYGEGKIFVPCQKDNLDDGLDLKGCFLRVYDAETLEQLYVTESLPSGQMQSPVMYHDGYFVTGTYGRNGVYAGFTADDEDTTRGDEIKKIEWTVDPDGKYGFSFNGAAFVGDYCYFGYGSSLYVVDYKTGEQRTFDIGEGHGIHSTVVYSEEMGRLYISANHAKGGAAVFSYELGSDGMPKRGSVKEWASGLENGGTQSTPVIYNGRLYLGGGGGTMGSAEPFHVLDAKNLKEIYSVPVLSKGSAGVSVAYAAAENRNQVYIYMLPYEPDADGNSELWIISDREGQTKAKYEVIDYEKEGEYCSQSVVVAKDGTLIWYTDGGYLYCFENSTGIFDDTESHWGREYVAFLARKGIVDGIGDGLFAPNKTVTRAQFVQMLAKMSGDDISTAKAAGFDDVTAGKWFAPAVNWAAEQGIITQKGGNFRPNEDISRQDMALMLYLYAQNVAVAELKPVKDKISFTDSGSIAAEAAQAVSAMQRSGIIDGMPDGSGVKFAPGEAATRAQAATMITRFYQALNEQD